MARAKSRPGGKNVGQSVKWPWRLFVPLAILALVFPLAVSAMPRPGLVHDAYSYAMTAQRLLRDGYFAYSAEPPGVAVPPNARVTPGWPLVLAGTYALSGATTGDAIAAVRDAQSTQLGVQFLFSVLIIVCVTLSGRLLGGDTVGILAGSMAALYLPFSWAATASLAEHLGAALVALGILLALRLTATSAARPLWEVVALGAVCGLTVIVRPNLLFWTFAPWAYVAVRRFEPPRRLAQMLAAGVLGFVLVMAPWWIRNAVVMDSFIPLKSDVGAATASGASMLSTDAPPSLPFADGAWVKTDVTLAPVIIGQPWIPYADFLVENTIHYDEVRIDVDPGWKGPYLVRVGAAPFAQAYHVLLVLLALASLPFIRRSPRIIILLGVPAAVLAVHLTHLNARYLYPTMPAVVIAAALAAYGLFRTAQRRLATAH